MTLLPAAGLIPIPCRARRVFSGIAPTTANQLHQWLRWVMDIDVPRDALTPGSSAPFEYLCHAFFEPHQHSTAPRDCVVWACRGGGKTFYAALATALELVFKPGIEIKVLGGSLEQSQRMHAYLRTFFERPELACLLDGRFESRRARLRNGSSVEVLAQSHTSVRGARPQKLRCDEVELFDPDVWRAAQLVTRSARCGDTFVRGSIEALSTMHAPFGLMADLTSEAAEPGSSRRLMRWGAVDVLESCPDKRPCESCTLWDECQGRAKASGQALRAGGHLPIDDAIRLKQRVDKATWEAEMLCMRPSRREAVLPEFDRDLHVSICEPPKTRPGWIHLIGMDFGFRSPTVVLWAGLDNGNVLRIIDERCLAETRLESHIQAIVNGGQRQWPTPAWVACDPAGLQRSAQTGASDAAQLRAAGLVVKMPRYSIEVGLNAIRARLAPASGTPSLWIHPRCTTLIDSLERYHYAHDQPGNPNPVKDGPDHAVDALRYLIASIDLSKPAHARIYW